MTPLAINVKQFVSPQGNETQIRDNIKRGLPELKPACCSHDGNFVIVASGPFLTEHIEDVRTEQAKGRPICAINGSYDFLVQHGIIPNLFLTVDPRPMPQNVTNPQHESVFLLASRVNPELFDRLKDHKVLVWHSWSLENECQEFKGKFAIGGGTTSGLRAINVGYVLGYRNFILYGMDSCLADDRKTKRFSGEEAGAIVDVIVGEKTFYCNHAMAQQANEFQELYKVMQDVHIEAKGRGLLAAILEERKRLGKRV
jgi:uncharacterized Rossmann fold enzyme